MVINMKVKPTSAESVALPQRLALLTGQETIRGTPFQAMYSLVETTGGPEVLQAACAAAGISPGSFNVMRKYSLKEFLLFEETAAARMAERLGSFDEAVFHFGAAAVDLFFDSVAGRTMKILAGKEPHRLLGATANGYSVLVNFGKREYQKRGERAGVFTFADELLGPVHSAGIFDAAVRNVYNMDVEIQLEQAGPTNFTFLLSW
jgi:uncharacterized protein (TIGR02265 family)